MFLEVFLSPPCNPDCIFTSVNIGYTLFTPISLNLFTPKEGKDGDYTNRHSKTIKCQHAEVQKDFSSSQRKGRKGTA
jgi:hypothetical protein